MNASLPGLPLATDSAGAGAGLSGELQVIQGDSVDQAGFAPLLEQAYAAVDEIAWPAKVYRRDIGRRIASRG
mgnify:CR=1 FL=1